MKSPVKIVITVIPLAFLWYGGLWLHSYASNQEEIYTQKLEQITQPATNYSLPYQPAQATDQCQTYLEEQQEPAPIVKQATKKYNLAKTRLAAAGLKPTKMLIIVDISDQVDYVFEDGELVAAYFIATGSKNRFDGDRSMTEAIWKIASKKSGGMAPLYGPRLMLLSKWSSGQWVASNIALHGTNEPEILGTPQSMGCIYHSNSDIKELYPLMSVGDIVVTIK